MGKEVMEKSVTVNKIGGANMSELGQVLALVKYLQNNNESPFLVVSAFKGVTKKLVLALDELDGTNYNEDSIREAFKDALSIVNGKINEFIEDEEYKKQARDHIEAEMNICIQTLLTHKEVAQALAPDKKTYNIRDKIIAFRARSAIGALEAYLNENKISAKAINDIEYKGNGEDIRDEISKRELHRGIQKGIAEAVKPHKGEIGKVIHIIGGHVGNVLRGMVPEIGWSYTDTTAVDLALALKKFLGIAVEKIVAWKDVDGVLSANPDQLGPDNTPVVHHDISFEEAMELAAAGSIVMQGDALELALMEKLTLLLKNIKKPDQEGTTFSVGKTITEFPFKTILSNDVMDVVTFKSRAPNFRTIIAKEFTDMGIAVMTLPGGTSASYVINLPLDKSDRRELRNRIRKVLARFNNGVNIEGEIYECSSIWNKNKASVVVIGEELVGIRGVLSDITGALAAEGINIDGVAHNLEQKIIYFCVEKRDAQKAVQTLHKRFIDSVTAKLT